MDRRDFLVDGAVALAAFRLPERPSRRVLVAAFLVSVVASTVGPGPTNTSVPLLVAGAWFLGNSVRARRLYTETLEANNRELERARRVATPVPPDGMPVGG